MTLTEFLLARNAEQKERCRLLLDSNLLPQSLSVRRTLKTALAECEAKRRIIERYQAQLDRQGDPDESQLSANICVTEYEDWILPALALPYADHPDYQQEWQP